MSQSIRHIPASAVLRLLVKGVYIESIRRREVSVALLFIGLFAVGAVVTQIVGTESEAAAGFVLNLGLSLSIILSLIVTVLMGARQFPDELEHRSLYPLLAKPVSRNQYVAGKWLATWLTGSLLLLVLNGLVLVTCPWPAGLNFGGLAQMLLLEVAATALAGGIATLLSVVFPKVIGMVLSFVLVFAAGSLVSLAKNLIPDKSIAWLASYLPDFGRLDLVNRFTGGGAALGLIDFASRTAWAGISTFFCLALAMYIIARRPL